MRYFALFVLLVFLVAYANCTACGTHIIRCAAKNENCTAGATDGLAIAVNPAVCPDGAGDISSPPSCTTCQAGLYCRSDGVCDDIALRTCTSTPQCQSFIPDTTRIPQICSFGLCVDDPSDIYSHGDTCSTTLQCIGAMTCSGNSTCTNPGSSCTTSAECATSDFCSSGSCVARKAVNGLCLDDPDQECTVGLVCAEGVCRLPFVGIEESDCSDALSQQLACLDGFQCQQEPTNMTFVCNTHPNVIGSGCVANLAGECSTVKGGKCLCSLASGSGECFPDIPRSICSTEWIIYMACIQTNGCYFDTSLQNFYPGTCPRANCVLTYASLVSCLDQPRNYVSNNCGTVDAARVLAGLPALGTSEAPTPSPSSSLRSAWSVCF